MDGDDDEIERVRRACTRFLTWHGERDPAGVLRALPDDIAADRYGEGGAVAELESMIAELLDLPAAAFFPSGTMAQQIALRLHADQRGRRTIAFHPTCHIDEHEGRAYERLHQLVGRPVGRREVLLRLGDLQDVAEPLAALVLELPQRELGGLLPGWDELVAQTSWARERGAAVHLDGARLWQCAPAFGRSVAEIAALFDSVYVSLYKDLGGLSGACLAGSAELVGQAREWRQRHGGTLFAMWPYAASALTGLRDRLPRMAQYRDHALAIADALHDLEGVRVVPDPPHTSMMHLHLRVGADHLRDAVLGLAREQGVWTWRASAPGPTSDWRVVELVVGDATLDFEPAEVRSIVERILAAASGPA